jgi:hypothetical protein
MGSMAATSVRRRHSCHRFGGMAASPERGPGIQRGSPQGGGRTRPSRVSHRPESLWGCAAMTNHPAMRRMAVMLPTSSMLATFTTSPLVGAWTIWPLPV